MSKIQLRRDTAANWASSNPVLAAGEVGWDSTNTQLRIGDGSTAWATLPVAASKPSDLAAAQLVAINTQTGTAYTLALSDANKAVECSNASAITLTVPPNSSVAFPVGTVIEVVQTGAGAITLAAGSGVTINGKTGTTAQWGVVVLRKRGTDLWLAA